MSKFFDLLSSVIKIEVHMLCYVYSFYSIRSKFLVTEGRDWNTRYKFSKTRKSEMACFGFFFFFLFLFFFFFLPIDALILK